MVKCIKCGEDLDQVKVYTLEENEQTCSLINGALDYGVKTPVEASAKKRKLNAQAAALNCCRCVVMATKKKSKTCSDKVPCELPDFDPEESCKTCPDPSTGEQCKEEKGRRKYSAKIMKILQTKLFSWVKNMVLEEEEECRDYPKEALSEFETAVEALAGEGEELHEGPLCDIANIVTKILDDYKEKGIDYIVEKYWHKTIITPAQPVQAVAKQSIGEDVYDSVSGILCLDENVLGSQKIYGKLEEAIVQIMRDHDWISKDEVVAVTKAEAVQFASDHQTFP